MHTEFDISIADNYADLVPIQRQFLMLAQEEHGPDEPSKPTNV